MARLENKIEKAITPLINMYEKIENELLIEIASHFSINEEFLNSDYWRVQKLQEMGLFNEKVIEFIAKYSNKTKKQVFQALNQIGIDTLNLDHLNKLFEDEVLTINPNKLLDNYTIKNIINTSFNEVSNRFIQMSSQIAESTRNAYLNVVEEAYLKTSMGTHSYQEAIRSSLDDLSNKGLRVLTYSVTDDEGNIVGLRHYDVESTARREILTASRQLSNNINLEVANELDCEYLYLSEHIKCRPQHFDWQGTIIKKEDLIKVTDYGSITGLGGINCAHYAEPYFGDARGNDLKTISLEEATEQYNLSQKQRYLERGIRKWKRKAQMFKASDNIDDYNKCVRKVNEWQVRNKEFTEIYDLKRDYSREYVSSYKEKVVQLKPSQNIVNTLKDVGIKADDSLSRINGGLLRSNVNQIRDLSKKYEMEDFYYDMNPTYYCNDKGSIACISYSKDMTYFNINSSHKYFKSKESLLNVMDEMKKVDWFMPCDEKKYNIYAMTHEFGHILEMKLYKNNYPFGNSSGFASFSNKVKDDIIKVAIKNNEKFDYFASISKYGDKNSKEFFAEVFANMELGKPNELGIAMKEYLKDKGVLK